MSTFPLRIPKARFVTDGGKTVYVLLPGTPWQKDSVYYSEAEHKGRLLCPDCNAPVHFRHGTLSTSGSTFKGRDNHFALFPGGRHEADCSIPNAEPQARNRIVDKEKGFRIHINTRRYSDAFNEASEVYQRLPNGKMRVLEDDLRDRAIRTIRSTRELIGLIEEGDHKRLMDSVVIFRNQSMKWEDFFLRPSVKNGYPDYTRYASLLKRLQQSALPETYCAMEVETTTRLYAGRAGSLLSFSKINLPVSDNIFESIVPQVVVRNHDDGYLRNAFSRPGKYLVMGVPRLTTKSYQSDVVHYVKIMLDGNEAVEPFDIRASWKKGLENAGKRQEKQLRQLARAP